MRRTCIFSLLIQHRSNRLAERRYFILHDVPDDFRIKAEILMNQNVAKPGNFLPFHCRMLGSEILREFLDGLTDYFQVPDHRIKGFLITQKRGFRQARRIGCDLPSSLQNVFQVDSRMPGA